MICGLGCGLLPLLLSFLFVITLLPNNTLSFILITSDQLYLVLVPLPQVWTFILHRIRKDHITLTPIFLFLFSLLSLFLSYYCIFTHDFVAGVLDLCSSFLCVAFVDVAVCVCDKALLLQHLHHHNNISFIFTTPRRVMRQHEQSR